MLLINSFAYLLLYSYVGRFSTNYEKWVFICALSKLPFSFYYSFTHAFTACCIAFATAGAAVFAAFAGAGIANNSALPMAFFARRFSGYRLVLKTVIGRNIFIVGYCYMALTCAAYTGVPACALAKFAGCFAFAKAGRAGNLPLAVAIIAGPLARPARCKQKKNGNNNAEQPHCVKLKMSRIAPAHSKK